MKLILLNPRFLSHGGEGISDLKGNPIPETMGVGIILDCPCGYKDDLYVPFSNPIGPGPYIPINDEHHHVWERIGYTFDDLTLSPSIRRKGNTCGWHGYIKNGTIESCGDGPQHKLK